MWPCYWELGWRFLTVLRTFSGPKRTPRKVPVNVVPAPEKFGPIMSRHFRRKFQGWINASNFIPTTTELITMQLSVTSSLFKYNCSYLLKNYFLLLKCFPVEIFFSFRKLSSFIAPFWKISLFEQPCGCSYLWIEITVSLRHMWSGRQFQQRISPYFTPNLPMVGVNSWNFHGNSESPFQSYSVKFQPTSIGSLIQTFKILVKRNLACVAGVNGDGVGRPRKQGK